MPTYDYIIIGAGLSGLMLADAMGRDTFFRGKSILLLDKDTKKTNDRTWCFWEKGNGDFDKLVHKSWEHILFAGTDYELRRPLSPYIYKLVRGIDFYDEYLGRIADYPNILIQKAEVLGTVPAKQEVEVITDLGPYRCKKVFNSVMGLGKMVSQNKFPVLQQHFLGWFLKTEKPVFDGRTVTFMDFSIPQNGNTRFIYVLPFSQTEALVEYTLFSKIPLPEEEYEEGIHNYLKNRLKCYTYTISGSEKGRIPMTCYDFASANGENIFHIGTAGGWTKASTGFTFMNTYRKTRSLVQLLKKGRSLDRLYRKNRFWFYDLLLLDILHLKNDEGSPIFEALFKKCPPQLIFKFLDGDTNLWEDLRIIRACPKGEFIGALWGRIFKKGPSKPPAS